MNQRYKLKAFSLSPTDIEQALFKLHFTLRSPSSHPLPFIFLSHLQRITSLNLIESFNFNLSCQPINPKIPLVITREEVELIEEGLVGRDVIKRITQLVDLTIVGTNRIRIRIKLKLLKLPQEQVKVSCLSMTLHLLGDVLAKGEVALPSTSRSNGQKGEGPLQ